jgi:hypothetical protein
MIILILLVKRPSIKINRTIKLNKIVPKNIFVIALFLKIETDIINCPINGRRKNRIVNEPAVSFKLTIILYSSSPTNTAPS